MEKTHTHTHTASFVILRVNVVSSKDCLLPHPHCVLPIGAATLQYVKFASDPHPTLQIPVRPADDRHPLL